MIVSLAIRLPSNRLPCLMVLLALLTLIISAMSTNTSRVVNAPRPKPNMNQNKDHMIIVQPKPKVYHPLVRNEHPPATGLPQRLVDHLPKKQMVEETIESLEEVLNGPENLPTKDTLHLQRRSDVVPNQQQLFTVTSYQQVVQPETVQSTTPVQTSPVETTTTNKTITIPITPKVQVLFYDPAELPEDTNIPSTIYDKNGNEVDVSGHQVLLMNPEENLPEAENRETLEKKATLQLSKKNLSNKRQTPKDNMIVLGTVLTMAVFVGAITGKRMRKSCNFLSYFIESEEEGDMEEQESLVHDYIPHTPSTLGSSSIYDGQNYNTFHQYGGDLRWRGDLEKFDV